MTFLKKILGGLVFVFFVMPACIATIAAIQLQLTAPSNIMYLFGFAAASALLAHRLWTDDESGFIRQIVRARAKWGADGNYSIPANLRSEVFLMKRDADANLWFEGEAGNLHLAAKHLEYTGRHGAKRVPWASVASMAAGKGVLEICAADGELLRWQGKGIDASFCAASELLWKAADASVVPLEMLQA